MDMEILQQCHVKKLILSDLPGWQFAPCSDAAFPSATSNSPHRIQAVLSSALVSTPNYGHFGQSNREPSG
jgi:hypothetical protein